MDTTELLVLLLSYLIGAVPYAYLVARKVARVDIRTIGDANVGARNVAAHAGFWAGMLVAILDVGKGALAVSLARSLHVSSVMVMLAGLLVVLGHQWTVFLRFHGGKGIAAAAGVFAVLLTRPLLVALSLGMLVYVLFRVFDLSAFVAFVAVVVAAWAMMGQEDALYVVLVTASIALKKVADLPIERRMKEQRQTGHRVR